MTTYRTTKDIIIPGSLRIGEFMLTEGYGGPASISIVRASGEFAGEGGDFHIDALEAVIRKFYEDNF
jgi:hypothetical protein